jgi:hypothetical protein
MIRSSIASTLRGKLSNKDIRSSPSLSEENAPRFIY